MYDDECSRTTVHVRSFTWMYDWTRTDQHDAPRWPNGLTSRNRKAQINLAPRTPPHHQPAAAATASRRPGAAIAASTADKANLIALRSAVTPAMIAGPLTKVVTEDALLLKSMVFEGLAWPPRESEQWMTQDEVAVLLWTRAGLKDPTCRVLADSLIQRQTDSGSRDDRAAAH